MHLRELLPPEAWFSGKNLPSGGLAYSVGRAKTGHASLPTRRRPVFWLSLVHVLQVSSFCRLPQGLVTIAGGPQSETDRNTRSILLLYQRVKWLEGWRL